MVTKRTPDVQAGVRATDFESAAARWERLAQARSDEISLAEGALLIAAEEYEDLDVAEYLQRIDAMGAALRQRLREDISTSDALVALNR
jgi:regulator of sirC expression with transglutaminase-like and TPR domain